VLGTPELTSDPRFADGESRIDNEAELLTIVRPAIEGKSTAYWAGRLREADIMHERLNSFRDFLGQPQAEAIDLVSFLELPDAPEAFPVPNIAGMGPFAKGTPRAITPVPGSTPARSCRSTAIRRTRSTD
jgi:crotonobetainyl-CoA:carnitine CoA-transferase CaiB-like acyl-CoA transferase